MLRLGTETTHLMTRLSSPVSSSENSSAATTWLFPSVAVACVTPTVLPPHHAVPQHADVRSCACLLPRTRRAA